MYSLWYLFVNYALHTKYFNYLLTHFIGFYKIITKSIIKKTIKMNVQIFFTNFWKKNPIKELSCN